MGRPRAPGWPGELANGPRACHNVVMTEILQRHLPDDMRAGRALPGIQPETGPWLRVDEAYAAQMARREVLLGDYADDVLYLDPGARPAAEELLEQVLTELPGLGFEHVGDSVRCPDGREVRVDARAGAGWGCAPLSDGIGALIHFNPRLIQMPEQASFLAIRAQ